MLHNTMHGHGTSSEQVTAFTSNDESLTDLKNNTQWKERKDEYDRFKVRYFH